MGIRITAGVSHLPGPAHSYLLDVLVPRPAIVRVASHFFEKLLCKGLDTPLHRANKMHLFPQLRECFEVGTNAFEYITNLRHVGLLKSVEAAFYTELCAERFLGLGNRLGSKPIFNLPLVGHIGYYRFCLD